MSINPSLPVGPPPVTIHPTIICLAQASSPVPAEPDMVPVEVILIADNNGQKLIAKHPGEEDPSSGSEHCRLPLACPLEGCWILVS